MSINLDDLFDTKPRQQQQQQQKQVGGLRFPPPPPPSDPPPPPVIQQDPFGMNMAAPPPSVPPPPFDAVASAPVTAAVHFSPYAPAHVSQSYGSDGHAVAFPSSLSTMPPSGVPPPTAYQHNAPTLAAVAYSVPYQSASPTTTGSFLPVQNTQLPLSPPPTTLEPEIAPTDVKTNSALSQEEEDLRQLEKIIQLRKKLEEEREQERKKREELETWGCPSCTYRNALDANECAMCETRRPGYNPPANVGVPATIHSDSSTLPVLPAKSVALSSEMAGPTAWLCNICLAPNEAHCSRCKVCNSYQKNGTPITAGNTRAPGALPASVVPPTAWLCGNCGRKNRLKEQRCEACGTYQGKGTPVVDLESKLQPTPEVIVTTWNCSVCTLENSVRNALCEACQSGQRPRHLAPPSGNDHGELKNGNNSHTPSAPKSWECPVCTYENGMTVEKCEMCSHRRVPQPKQQQVPKTTREEDSDDDIQWQDDLVVQECNKCHQRFNFTRRRHHCRACGFVFCATCSAYQLVVKKNGPRERVCVSCYEAHK